MALSPALEDRELGKFRDVGDVTLSKVAIHIASSDVQQGSVPTSVGSNTRPSINNVSSTILASNANRKYALITNNNGFTAYLKLGSAAVVNQGIPLGPNERYEISANNLWTGDIRAIKSTSTSANLDVFEGT